MTVSPAEKRRTLNSRAICSTSSRIEPGEERHASSASTGIARRRAGSGVLLVRRPRRDRAALQQVERSVRERPLDVARRAVDLLAPERELGQLGELLVVEAELLGAVGRDLLLDRAARRDASGSRSACGPGCARAPDPSRSTRIGVGDHEAGDDRLAESPARLDHALVGAGDRVLREHHPGDVGIEQRLHDDADARAREQADALAVGDRRVRVRRPPDLAQRRRHVVGRRHVEQREVLAGEARVLAVLVDGGRAHRERHPQRSRSPSRPSRSRLRPRRQRPRRPGPDSATPGGTGRPSRIASPSPTAFDPKTDDVARLRERDDLLHAEDRDFAGGRRRRARACRRRCGRSPRACRRHPGCRTRARRSPSARAGRRCRSRSRRAAAARC